jgi:endonuclease/exonuclease/phosphatase family metal-dependent hydrolase
MKKLVLIAAVLLVSVTFTYAQFRFTSIDYPGGTATVVASPSAHERGAHSFLKVMTRNMDEGTDFGYIIAAAGNPSALQSAIVQTFCEVVASNPELRAAQMADEIAAAQPDLVSLQEVAEWQSSVTLPCTGPTTIDAETALLDRLAVDGVSYHVVSQLDEFNSVSIFGSTLPFSFLDRDVLLARDEPDGQLTIANVQAQHFTSLLVLPLAPGVNATILRGWISADATVRGRSARVIATHLESFYEPVQVAQAAELAVGPGDTSLPVVIAGDLNTGPGSNFTFSYDLLTQNVGFTDTWAVTRPNDPGYTDNFYTEDPLTLSTPSMRIDLVLVRGAVVPSAPKDYLVGTEIPHPSDHAGVVAKVSIP